MTRVIRWASIVGHEDSSHIVAIDRRRAILRNTKFNKYRANEFQLLASWRNVDE